MPVLVLLGAIVALAVGRVTAYARVVAVLVLLGALVALDRIDVALRSAHPANITNPGVAAGGFGDIATPARLSSPRVGVGVARGWETYSAAVGSLAVDSLIRWYVMVDLLLMGSIFMLLLVAGNPSRRVDDRGGASEPQPEKEAPTSERRPRGGAATLAYVAAVVYLIFDLAETLSVALLWRGITDPGVKRVAALSLIKWLGLATALFGLVAMRVPNGDGLAWRRTRNEVSAFRGPLLVSFLVVALMVGLGGDLGRQMDDVIVRAAEVVYPALLSTVLALLAWWIQSRAANICLRAYEKPPEPVPAKDRRKLSLRVGLPCLVLAIVGVVAGTAVPQLGDYRGVFASAGAGFGLVALLFLPDLFLPADEASPEPVAEERTGQTEKSRWVIALCGVPLLALFVAVVRAATTTSASQLFIGSRSDSHAMTALWAWVALTSVGWVLGRRWLETGKGMKQARIREVPRTQSAGSSSRLAANTENSPVVADPATQLRVVSDASVGDAETRQVSNTTKPEASKKAVRPLWYWVTLGLLPALALVPPLSYAEWLGTPGILMLAIITWTGWTTALTILGDHWRAAGLLAWIGLRRTPVFSLLALWALLAALVDPIGAYYRVRAGDFGSNETTPVAKVFDHWRNSEPRSSLPLVLVAAPGGGIRAAYWTRLGMDCAFGTACGGTDITKRIFLASGVSGGAVGLVGVRARQLAHPNPEPVPEGEATTSKRQEMAADVLADDFLAPSLAAFLFRDVPNAYLRLPIQGVNRADTLELAWEKAQPGLDAPFQEQPNLTPRLVLNATSVEDGCRLALADVDLRRQNRLPALASNDHGLNCSGSIASDNWPGYFPVRDAREWTSKPLRLSTAALNAARFPYVSPAGMFQEDTSPPTFALDGGLVDNSGATALLQALHSLKVDKKLDAGSTQCVSPRLVIFDSTQATSGNLQGTDRPLHLLAPIASAMNGFRRNETTPTARLADEVAALAHACDQTSRQDAVVVISPKEQPNSGLPLGWTLSELSRDQMSDMMSGKHTHISKQESACSDNDSNWCELRKVRHWLDKPAA